MAKVHGMTRILFAWHNHLHLADVIVPNLILTWCKPGAWQNLWLLWLADTYDDDDDDDDDGDEDASEWSLRHFTYVAEQ